MAFLPSEGDWVQSLSQVHFSSFPSVQVNLILESIDK